MVSGAICLVSAVVIFICGIFILGLGNGSGSSSTSSQTYSCGFCGKTMNGGYYDYIEGKYACRSCSKTHRNR